METKYGFTKMSLSEFKTWLGGIRIGRTVLFLHMHHTYIPDYSLFDGSNHFALQKGMQNHHVNHNGWHDIGQHFTTFPDGSIMTGRDMELSPACIYGNNANSLCIENLGNFDINEDIMTTSHKDTITGMTAALCERLSIPVNTDKIIYHHWYNLSTGQRNNGTGGNKSCPGSNFFEGNKVSDAENEFLPLVQAAVNGPVPDPPLLIKYVCVTAGFLNIRKGPGSSFGKVERRAPATLGAILRVYGEQGNWYKISNSKEHWVSARYTFDVKRALVNATTLNVRSGPGTGFNVVGSVHRGHEVFIQEELNNWCKISMEHKWVSKSFLDM